MSAKAGIPGALLLTLACASLAPCADPPARRDTLDLLTLAPQVPGARDAGAPSNLANPADLYSNSATPLQFAPAGSDPFASGPGMPGSGTGSVTPGSQTPAEPSSWITYRRPGCCGPRGGCGGPVTYELYVRTGPSLPTGPSNSLASTLETGWMVQGGGRSLFYNPTCTSAWVIDLGLGNIYNHGNQPNRTFAIPQSFFPVATLSMNRTYVSAGGGKEWYLHGAANNCDWNWRIGWDGGGQMGTERLDLRDPGAPNGSNYRRRNDVIGGLYTGLYTDVTIPMQSCSFIYGFRAEWLYTFSDIVPINSDISSVNLLMNFGLRF